MSEFKVGNRYWCDRYKDWYTVITLDGTLMCILMDSGTIISRLSP